MPCRVLLYGLLRVRMRKTSNWGLQAIALTWHRNCTLLCLLQHRRLLLMLLFALGCYCDLVAIELVRSCGCELVIVASSRCCQGNGCWSHAYTPTLFSLHLMRILQILYQPLHVKSWISIARLILMLNCSTIAWIGLDFATRCTPMVILIALLWVMIQGSWLRLFHAWLLDSLRYGQGRLFVIL